MVRSLHVTIPQLRQQWAPLMALISCISVDYKMRCNGVNKAWKQDLFEYGITDTTPQHIQDYSHGINIIQVSFNGSCTSAAEAHNLGISGRQTNYMYR